MSNLNDIAYIALSAQGYSGHISQMIYDWQGDNGATDLHINDRWDQIFDAASIPEGNMSDRLYAWLGNLGHTQDNVNARWQSYWENTEAPSEDIMFWNDDDEVLWNDDDEVLW